MKRVNKGHFTHCNATHSCKIKVQAMDTTFIQENEDEENLTTMKSSQINTTLGTCSGVNAHNEKQVWNNQ